MRHAAITLNPYQGLKLSFFWVVITISDLAAITLNPYQGLKPLSFKGISSISFAAITLNPYQGLKQREAVASRLYV